MDISDSVNMALDLSQVEGGLLMRIGHHKSETITWDSNGKVNDLCAAYMIPTAKDLPEDQSIILTNDQSGQFWGGVFVDKVFFSMGFRLRNQIIWSICSVKPFKSKNRDKIDLDPQNPNLKKSCDRDF